MRGNWLGHALKYVMDAWRYAADDADPSRGRFGTGKAQLRGEGSFAVPLGRMVERETRRVPDPQEDAYRIAVMSSWIFSDIQLISDRVASRDAAFVVKQRKAGKLEQIDDHPFLQLMNRPNPLMSGSFLKRYTNGWYKLRGNAYLFIATERYAGGEPKELWPLVANLVTPQPETLREGRGVLKGQMVIDYTYHLNGQEQLLPGEHVIHIRTPNPFDYWEGLSPLVAGLLPAQQDRAQAVWQRDFYKEDNAIPSAVVALSQELNDYDFDRYVDDIKDQLEQGQKRLFTRSGDLNVSVISQTLEQMQIIQSREFTRDEIDRIYGVPKGIYGDARSGEDRLGADIAFSRNAIQPTLDVFAEQLTVDLSPFYGEDIVIEAPNVVPQDRALEVQEHTIYSQDRTLNENREERGLDSWKPPTELAGLAPWADVPVRLLSIAQAQAQNQAPPAQQPPQRFPAQDEDEPDVGNLPGAQDPAAMMDEQAGRAYAVAMDTELKRWRKVALREWRAGHNPAQRPFASEVFPQDVRAAVLEALQDATTEGEVKAAFEKGIERKQIENSPENGAPSDSGLSPSDQEAATAQPPFAPQVITPEWVKTMLLQLDPDDDEAEQKIRILLEKRTVRNLTAAMDDILREITRQEPENVEQFVRGVRPHFAPNRPLHDALSRGLQDAADLGTSVAVASLENVGFGFDWMLVNTQARDWALQYSGELIRSLERTTLDGIRQAVARWIENGESLDALVADLTPLLGKRRAELVASTEVTRAYAEANRRAYRASGVVTQLIWRTAADERRCSFCRSLDGATVGLEGSFHTQLPDDLRPKIDAFEIPPAHPRCRCWIVAEVS